MKALTHFVVTAVSTAACFTTSFQAGSVLALDDIDAREVALKVDERDDGDDGISQLEMKVSGILGVHLF